MDVAASMWNVSSHTFREWVWTLIEIFHSYLDTVSGLFSLLIDRD